MKKVISVLSALLFVFLTACMPGNNNSSQIDSRITSDGSTITQEELLNILVNDGDERKTFICNEYLKPLFDGHILNRDKAAEDLSYSDYLLFYYANNMTSNSEFTVDKDKIETYLSGYFDVDFEKLRTDAADIYSDSDEKYNMTSFSEYDGLMADDLTIQSIDFDENAMTVNVNYSYVSDFEEKGTQKKICTLKAENGRLIFQTNYPALEETAKNINDAKAFFNYFYSGLGCSDEIIVVNSHDYYPVSDFADISTLREKILSYYSESAAQHFFDRFENDDYIIEHDGCLYVDRGRFDISAGYVYDTDNFIVTMISDNEATVEYTARHQNDPDTEETVSVKYIFNGERWVIDQYNI